MKSLWDEKEAQHWADLGGGEPAEIDLALRVYSSRLLGTEPDLVLHGGGNTSVKTRRPAKDGTVKDVIHVKGSGWDLATIEAPGLPAMWLDPLLRARDVPNMSDEEMVAFLRREMLDQNGPNASVEALLHAFIPEKFVDHTHSCAALAIADQPNAADICRDVFDDELCIIPYVMPGFKLSHAADQIIQKHGPGSSGMFLVNHGLFAYGATARQSYERIIDHTDRCENYLTKCGAALPPQEMGTRQDNPGAYSVIVDLQTALSKWDFFGPGGPVLDLRIGDVNSTYLATQNLHEVSSRGTATPDHVIRIKPRPMVGDVSFTQMDWNRTIRDYADWYESYFERNAQHADEPKTMLDPLPRVALIRGLGIVGIGRTEKESGIAADLAEQNARIILSAEKLGRFSPLSERDIFELEYWSLEQAKLKKPA